MLWCDVRDRWNAHAAREQCQCRSGTPFPVTGDGKKLPIQSVHCGPVGDRVSTWIAVRMLLDQ
ncbi:hypothetical protein HDF11_003385 [Tunturiibacter psychrotolerans]